MITQGFGNNTIITMGLGETLVQVIKQKLLNAVYFLRTSAFAHFFNTREVINKRI